MKSRLNCQGKKKEKVGRRKEIGKKTKRKENKKEKDKRTKERRK